MRVPHRTAHVISLLIVLAWAQGLEAKKSKKQICPIGFRIAYNRFRGDFVCYKRKELEPFAAALDDCDGNLYSSKLHRSLNISKLDYSNTLWTEYKSFYPGGPFVSWSRNEDDWVVVDEVEGYEPPSLKYDTDQDLCLVFNRAGEFIAVQCDDKYYRYCLVKPYSDREDMTKRGCESFKGSWRFNSSKDICLLGVTGVGGGTVRATWNQSQALCSKHGGTLLSRGWQYANMPFFHISDMSPTPTYPLGIVWDPEKRVLRYVSEDSVVETPFEMGSMLNDTDDTMFIAIREESWVAVNSSYLFFDVICERSVQPRNLSLTLNINSDNKIILDVNDSVDKDDIHCTTDSESYRPSKVKIHHDDDEDNYVLSPATDGYYWCEHVDRYNFQTTQSNKVLFVRERDSLINLYTVKINLINDNYTFTNADDKKDDWIDLLEEYVFYRTRYVQTFDDDKILDPTQAEEILKNFKQSRTELSWRDGEEIYNSVVKRLYVDRETVLLHVELNPEMIPVTPGTWGSIKVLFMKPAYYCKGFDSVPRLSLGQTTVSRGCRTYSCLGDFNEGVQWLESMTTDCTPSTSVPMGAYLTISDVTVRTPTVIPQKTTPDEQLVQVMQELEQLLNNHTAPLTVDMVDDAFDQVNVILEVDEDLEIPGELLHMLDEIGNRADLNGSGTAQTVRGNIALLIADTAPDNPVRGVRMALVDPSIDAFTNETFEFIGSEVNSTQLATNQSEAVVYLPESVTTTRRRISFLVYRNERAFRANQDVFVNSRVVSVNVENVTEFEAGEVIDIYLAPMNEDLDSNVSRACAYWHFLENSSGYWSTEGCVFIKSTEPGVMDVCRCDHLTHFAEILVPRTNFSASHEEVLEVLSVVGCCLSMFGIAFIVLTAVIFRAWRREFSNKIWLQLCIAIFLLVLCFLIIVFAKFDGYNVGCMLVGVALHYSVLASFCWMMVAAVISYRRLVLVFTREISHKLLRASAFSWGTPFAIVGVLLSVDPHSYAGRYEEKTPSGSFCYPSGLGLWLAVYMPIAVMLLANWTLFILIVRSVFASRRIQRHGDANEALRCACVSCLLVFLFGLPWIFGLFASNVVAAYFFTCTATFQGFVLFFFIVLGNKKTRDLWLDKLKIKRTRKVPVTTSTYTNRSVGTGGWQAPQRSTTSLEAKNLKPKSLSQDDSRFS